MLTEKEIAQYKQDIQDQDDAGFQNGAALSRQGNLNDIYDAFIVESMDTSRELNFEIGVLTGSKEVFTTQNVKDMANYFISMAKYKIEDEYDNISRWRKEKESCRV